MGPKKMDEIFYPAFKKCKLMLEIGAVYKYKNTETNSSHFYSKDGNTRYKVDNLCIMTLVDVSYYPENVAEISFIFDEKLITYRTRTNREEEFYSNYFMKIV